MQLKWSRFVKTTGRDGCNLPCDLHIHLKRLIMELCSEWTQTSTPPPLQEPENTWDSSPHAKISGKSKQRPSFLSRISKGSQ